MSSSPGSVGLARAHPLTKTQAMEPSRQTWCSYGPPYPLGRWSSGLNTFNTRKIESSINELINLTTRLSNGCGYSPEIVESDADHNIYRKTRPDNHKHQPPSSRSSQQPRHYYQCIKSSRTALKRLSSKLFNRNDKINA